MRTAHVPLKNDFTLVGAVGALTGGGPGPKIALVYGVPGLGKTDAAKAAALDCGAAFIRANGVMTLSSMLSAICHALGIEPKYRQAAKFNDICECLLAEPRPLFVDEADYLARDGRMLDVLRDIHDIAGIPVILVGMDQADRKLARNRQFASRVSQRIEFAPCDMADAAALAGGLCEVEVARDLLKALHKKSKGSARLIVVALAELERFAKGHGLKRITSKEWGGRPMFLGDKGEAADEAATAQFFDSQTR